MSLRPAVAAALAVVVLGAAAPRGEAQTDPPAPEPAEPLAASPEPTSSASPAIPALPTVFVGYLGGNGLGEIGVEGGVRLAPHVTLGLHAGRIAGAAGNGFGVAPLLRVSLAPHGGPYAALGASWFTIATDATTSASGTAVLAGVGYEWRALPQLALLAGVGAAFVPGTSVDRGGVVTPAAGGLKPNLEVGLRWYAF